MVLTVDPGFLTPPDDGAPPDDGTGLAPPDDNSFATDGRDVAQDAATTGGFVDSATAAAADPNAGLPGDGTRRNVASGLPDLTGPTPSPADLVAQGIDGAPATPAGQTGRPLTVEEQAFQTANPNGGSFTNPQAGALPGSSGGNGRPLTVEEQAFQTANPAGGSFTNPATGGTAPASASGTLPGSGGGGAPGQLTDQQWQDYFTKQFGYFDPTYDSRANFLHEAQMGDTAIRGRAAGGGADQLAGMAKYDSDAALLDKALSTGGAGAGIYGSQAAADWATQHNDPLLKAIDAITAAGGRANPQAAAQLEWLKSQTANVPANPTPNSQAFPVAAEIMSLLEKNGATNVQMHGTDIYYSPASGGTGVISGGDHISLDKWLDKLATLKDAAAAAAAPPASPTAPQAPGRGLPPRSSGYSAPRGGGYTAPRGGGGYAPPAAQAPPAPSFTGFATNPDVSNQNPIGSSANTDALAATRAAQFAALANENGGANTVPRSVASAVSYAPGIYPGGNSPYDQP